MQDWCVALTSCPGMLPFIRNDICLTNSLKSNPQSATSVSLLVCSCYKRTFGWLLPCLQCCVHVGIKGWKGLSVLGTKVATQRQRVKGHTAPVFTGMPLKAVDVIINLTGIPCSADVYGNIAKEELGARHVSIHACQQWHPHACLH